MSEAKRVRDRDSTYWITTRDSGVFTAGSHDELAQDDLRQLWRNHLLGLSMVRQKDIEKFVSVTLYPKGNKHFDYALKSYQKHLKIAAQASVRGCTFEHFIQFLSGDSEIEAWKVYLMERYLFDLPS